MTKEDLILKSVAKIELDMEKVKDDIVDIKINNAKRQGLGAKTWGIISTMVITVSGIIAGIFSKGG